MAKQTGDADKNIEQSLPDQEEKVVDQADQTKTDQSGPAITKENSELEKLNRQLDEKTREAEELVNRLARLQADYENFRRRTKNEKTEYLKYAGEQLITALLPVLDNFELALAAKAEPGENFINGVKMIYRQLQEVLQKEGLTALPAVGEQFDPTKHEAVMQVDNADQPENTVLEELRRGYALHGKIIRAAMVKVAKP